MKAILLLLFTFLMNSYSNAQTADTMGVSNSRPKVFGFPSQKSSGVSVMSPGSSDWWQIVSKENLTFKTNSLQLSAVEDKITDLESEECGALKNRDTMALVRIWARDFTQDGKQNKIVDSKNGLPNYLSLHRMTEFISEIDSNTVYTSGYEIFREIKATEKFEEERTRKYFHIWTRRNGMWKLTTKRFD